MANTDPAGLAREYISAHREARSTTMSMADAIMVHKCLRGVHRCDQHEEGGTDDRLSYIALMIDGATHSAQAHMKNAERIASRAKVLEVYDDFCEEVEALIAPDADSLLRADCIK